jgi:uroporphyrinogen-III synthase
MVAGDSPTLTESLVQGMKSTSKSGKAALLLGVRVLVGRARHQASALSSGLRDLGAEVLEIPFIEIRKPRSYKALDEALNHLSEYDWLILTSVNGVDAVWERLRRLHLGGKPMRHLKIAAIGPATRQAIEQHGLKVNVVPKEYVAESVVASLRRKVKGKRVLLARAKVARDVIPRELRKLGARVDVVEAYETVVPQASRQRLRAALASQNRRPDWITFTSSSTARNFVVLLGESRGRVGRDHLDKEDNRVRLASIGPVTSSTLRELGLPVDVEAAEYTIPGLIKAISSRR